MAGGNKSIRVSLSEFAIEVCEGDDVVREIHDCSFGRHEGENNLTPVIDKGALSSWKRKRDYKSATYPQPNGGAPMNFALFLEDHLAVAFHEGDTAAQSHGCIHLSGTEAGWLFDWAGTSPVAVSIAGPHPKPGTRALVYPVGAANMTERAIAHIRAALAVSGVPVGAGTGYDAALAAAVSAYQDQHGLMVDGKVSVTIFRREGDDGAYRDRIGAQTWSVADATTPTGTAASVPPLSASPRAAKGRCPSSEAVPHGHPPAPTPSTYALSEEQEPFAALPQGSGPPLLFAIRCQHPSGPNWRDRLAIRFGVKEPERCAGTQAITELVVAAAGAGPTKPFDLPGRYVSRVPIFRIGATEDFGAVFVRFALRKAADGVRLEGFARVVRVHGRQLTAGDEIPLGIVSPGSETKAIDAITRASRLVPLVGDTDGDGWPDLVIADPDNGVAALSYPSGYEHGRLAFGTGPYVRR